MTGEVRLKFTNPSSFEHSWHICHFDRQVRSFFIPREHMKFMGLLTAGKTIESPKELLKNTKIAIKEWNLMPMDVEAPNESEWRKMAKIRGVSVDEAKRQLCANCEYFDNTDSMMEAMDAVPENEYDVYGNYKAQRGYCTKLHFICHVPRSCQAWEAKDYESEDKEDMGEEDYDA